MKFNAYDSETHPIQPGMLTPKAVVLSHYSHDMKELEPSIDAVRESGPNGGLILFPQALDWFEEQLLNPESTLVGHNGAYDLAVVAVEKPELLELIFDALEEGRIRDTMVRGKLIDIGIGQHKFRVRDDGVKIRTSHSLASLAKLYLNVDMTGKKDLDAWRVRYHELDGVPLDQWPHEARTYAINDAKICLDLFDAQSEFVSNTPIWKGGVLANEVEQTKAAFVLHLMSVWGVTTDEARVVALKERLTKQLAGAPEFMLEKGLSHNTGSKKTPKWSKNTKAIKARVEAGYTAQGKRIPQTEGGATSIAEEVLLGSGDEDLKKLASFGLASTLMKSFIPLLERGTKSPIGARWNVMVESGRVSCSDPNLLNPPAGDEGVRECFTARPGYVFIDADYSVVEYRAWAQIHLDMFKRSSLAEVFRAGGDPHDNLLRSMNLSTDKNAYIEINGAKVPVRRFAKMLNFGLMSGMGCDTLIEYARGYDITISPRQAEIYKAKWMATIPEARPYFQEVSRHMNNQSTCTVVQRRSGRVRGGCKYTAAVNTQPQGLTSDGAKEGLWLIAREAYLDENSGLYGSRPVIHLYDENMIEAPEEKATAAAKRMVELMIEGMQKWIPDVPIVVSPPVVMKHWSKDAKSKMGEDGNLSVWDVED